MDSDNNIAAFLHTVWGHGPHSLCWMDRGVFRFMFCDSPRELLTQAVDLPDTDIWFGAHPLKGLPASGRGGRDDVAEIVALVADLDWAHPSRRTEAPLPTEAATRISLDRLGLPPSLVVNSGHGLHCWWLLDVPVDPDVGGRLQARLDAALEAVGLDNGRSDLASILRLPGTHNHKETLLPGPVTIDPPTSPLRRYLPEYLYKRLPAPLSGRGGGNGQTRHRRGAVTNAQQELANHVVQHHNGHDITVDRGGEIYLWRPGKTPRDGPWSATILVGRQGDPLLTVFSDHWPDLPKGSYMLGPDRQLHHPTDLDAHILIDATAASSSSAAGDVYQAEQGDRRLAAPAGGDEVELYETGRVTGASFVLDQPVALVARWGKGGDVLWGQGESCLLCGPPGVGKTTLAGQIVGGLIGVLPDVLGYPVLPARRVLYLALDRPRQIQRALRRLFDNSHRTALDQHLIVRRGPLPFDIGSKPQVLVKLARHYEADVVILDSLKDAAVNLSDDKVAGNVNRAIQTCNAADIDVLVLHHQRKSQEGKKPTSLEDVYGNTWITAGAGSVILLWGDPGSELIELSHLKQPAEVVGPLTVEHDHHRGTSKVTRGWDALAYLTMQGAAGATVAEAAQAHHGAPQTAGKTKWKQTERKLRALVMAGVAIQSTRTAVGQPTRFYAVMPQSSHGQPHGQST